MSDNAFFYVDRDGKKQDASLHQELLDSPEAEEAIARAAIERQLEAGMSLEDAVLLYGTERMREAVAARRPPF